MSKADRERELIGSIVVSPHLAPEAAQIVQVEDVTDPRCRAAFTAMVGLVDAGTSPDPFTLSARMSSNMKTQAGIVRWLAEVSQGIPGMTSLAPLCRWIHRTALVARAAQSLAELTERVRAAAASGEDAEWIETDVAGLAIEMCARDDERLRRVRYEDMETELASYFRRLLEHRTDPRAIPTGITALDRRLGGGLQPGKLHLIAAATGGGKTTIASQIADHAASVGKRAIMFTMEIDPLDVAIRDTERTARRSRWDLVRGNISMREAAIEELTDAVGSIVHANLRTQGKVMFGSSVSVDEIYRVVMVEGMRMGGPIDLVVIDHAQVVAPGKSKTAKAGTPTRYLEVKVIAERLREFAALKGFACVLTAQMNPPPKGERPSKEMIRESKDLANTADLVLLLHHEREVEERMPHEATRPRLGRIVRSEILIDKGRTASLGYVPVQYDGALFRYADAGNEEEQ